MFSPTNRTRPARRPGRPNPLAALATGGVAMLVLAGAVAPSQELLWSAAPAALPDQSVDVVAAVQPALAERDGFAAEISPERQKAALVADHTNYSWAKLVLWYGGWPITDESVTTIVRWMRQENYVDNWWLRNNPLNNGWGVGHFLNPAPSLDAAAEYAADAIHTLAGYAGIKAAFESAAGSAESAYAIWHSSWATGHYAYGAHWSTAPVPVVVAPADAWGI